MVFVSVDVEASGCIPVEYSLLSIGACVLDNPSNTFYAELLPINDNYTESAMKVVGDLWEECFKTGLSPKFVMKSFARWLEALNDRVVMVGFNAVFDWQFINYYFIKYLGYNPFGINALDIKAYFAGMMNVKWYETTKKRIKHRNPIFQTTAKHTHNALQDSIEQAELFRKMLEYNNEKKEMYEEE